ncbi:Beta-galactosidase C-terminal domain, partial [Nocardioides sp. NPDC000441]|uniref:Beta-galactosidase C-terminal domain n=1 Tax=Nocardioides sp. NPDC000441 TaxID=3154256 RepID=UPI003331E2AC
VFVAAYRLPGGLAATLTAGLRGRVELAIRADGEREYWFLVNRTDDVVDLGELDELGGLGEPMFSSGADRGVAELAGSGVAVFTRTAR